jgi:hypothetical protein
MLSQVGEPLGVHWPVTGTSNQPILAFDRSRAGNDVFDPNARNDAYVQAATVCCCQKILSYICKSRARIS